MSEVTQFRITTPRKVVAPYDSERYALKASDVDIGDIVYVASTGSWWFVIDTDNLDSDAGYDQITSGSDTPTFASLTVTGDADIGGDLDVTDDANVGGDLAVTGTINGLVFGAAVITAAGTTLAISTSSFSAGSISLGTGYVGLLGSQSALPTVNASEVRIYRTGNSGGAYPFNEAGHVVLQPRDTGAVRDVVFMGGNPSVVNAIVAGAGALRTIAGTFAIPSQSFIADPDTGFYSVGANTIGVSAGGALVFSVNTAFLFGVGTGSPAITSGIGAVGAPAYTFTGDTTTGIYRVGASTVGLSAGGALAFTYHATYLFGAGTNAAAVKSADSTVGAPGFSFVGDSDSGLYRIGADNIGLAVGGVKLIDIGAAGVGVGGSTYSATTRCNLLASSTGISSLRIAHGTAPSAPVDGDIWTTTAGIFVRVNGATVGPLS